MATPDTYYERPSMPILRHLRMFGIKATTLRQAAVHESLSSLPHTGFLFVLHGPSCLGGSRDGAHQRNYGADPEWKSGRDRYLAEAETRGESSAK